MAEMSTQHEALNMLSSARASTDRAASAPNNMPVPDDTTEILATIVDTYFRKGLGACRPPQYVNFKVQPPYTCGSHVGSFLVRNPRNEKRLIDCINQLIHSGN